MHNQHICAKDNFLIVYFCSLNLEISTANLRIVWGDGRTPFIHYGGVHYFYFSCVAKDLYYTRAHTHARTHTHTHTHTQREEFRWQSALHAFRFRFGIRLEPVFRGYISIG